MTDDVLARFDEQVRRNIVPAPGWSVEHGFGGKVLRQLPPAESHFGGYVSWTDLDESNADAAIAEQVQRFDPSGRRWEWKTYGYDRPDDLPDRLSRAGFVAEEMEALVVGEMADVVAATSGAQPPEGVVVRCAEGPDDYARIAAVHGEVWGGDHGWLAVELAAEKAGGPDALEVLLAETVDGAEVVCAAWVRFEQGTDFASLWGGSTLEGWRGRGIYRALVAQRAAMAAERGFRYLQVDASPDSRPILERLGLRQLTTTTPFVRTP
ncbi:MAG: hypothetical protein QOJ49_1593 [Actinomycetota bacterium]|nr:hypothetical protein [Actinomycetota bacterium]